MTSNTITDSPKSQQAPSFTIIRKLGKGKFSIYLVSLENSDQVYALKLFPYQDNKPNSFYTNESRFQKFEHQNLCRINHSVEKLQKGSRTFSYTIMDFASKGDLFDLIINNQDLFSEKLARTYFRQIVDGLHYLHSNGAAHLDLKPDNILIDVKGNIKICDFDLSYIQKDETLCRGKGTTNFRAPEVAKQSCEDPFAADIYSAGILLFVLMTGGKVPQTEGELYKSHDLADLLHNNIEKFWAIHEELFGKQSNDLGNDFKELFQMMTRFNPKDRATLDQVKRSRWYKGPVLTESEMKDLIQNQFHVEEIEY